jgi:hypothetical protein
VQCAVPAFPVHVCPARFCPTPTPPLLASCALTFLVESRGGNTPLGKASRDDSDLAESFNGKASIEARGGGDEQQPAPRTKSHASFIRAEASGTPRRGVGSRGGDGSPSAAIAPASGNSLHTGGQSSRRDRDRGSTREGESFRKGADGSARPDTSGKPGVSPASQRQHASQEKRKSDVPQDMQSSKSGTESKIDKIVCTRYKLGRVLGKGSFGVIHSAVDIHTNEMVAVKIESKSVKVSCSAAPMPIHALYPLRISCPLSDPYRAFNIQSGNPSPDCTRKCR